MSEVLRGHYRILLESNNQKVTYFFTDTSVIRITPENTDTFHLQINSVVLNGLENHPEYIQSIDLQILVGGLSYPVYLIKKYDKQFLFELEKLNGN